MLENTENSHFLNAKLHFVSKAKIQALLISINGSVVSFQPYIQAHMVPCPHLPCTGFVLQHLVFEAKTTFFFSCTPQIHLSVPQEYI